MDRIAISTLFLPNSPVSIGESIRVCGWIRTIRSQKSFAFLSLSDGSYQHSLQVLIDYAIFPEKIQLSDLTTGASLEITGKLVESPGAGQSFELRAESLHLLGSCPSNYPLQKKRHSFEFLRSIAHLRCRTNTQGAIARIRSRLAFATHQFFQDRDFLYLQSPILTSSDCEGAGKLFQVTNLNIENPPKTEEQAIDYSKDFFSTPTYLTVSGQLNGEAYASAFSSIYTFGPTFRAENSHTSRHLAEFWMIEPEMAFVQLPDIIRIAKEYLQYVLKEMLDKCPEDLSFCNQWIEKGLLDRLETLSSSPFHQITYTEAIAKLKQAPVSFEYPIEWGSDLQSEHERYLTDSYYKGPVILTHYPKTIKPFYMREASDQNCVEAFDLLVPRIGEIIGGSQREERYDHLREKIIAHGLDSEKYKWYLDLRLFGSVPHGGFGVGFERLVQLVTGMENIRDVIPFPRTSGNCFF